MIMALDHTRELLHVSSLSEDPTNLATTTPGLFFTRWITHLCAPIFVFLSGTSVYLQLKRRDEVNEVQRFLFFRGVLLIFLEMTIVNFGIWFDPLYRTLMFQVIFAIGAGFVLLSLLLRLPSRTLLLLGLLIITGHNLLDQLKFGKSFGEELVRYLFYPTFLKGDYLTFFQPYPIIPWLGIMLFGFGFGEVYFIDRKKRNKILLLSGVSFLVVFLVLRWGNIYGDPALWRTQSTGLFTFLSFMNLTKYPPSLLYTSVTLGVMFLVLMVSENESSINKLLVIYGRVPLFFYVVHWYVIHISMLVLVLLQGYSWNEMSFVSFGFGRPGSGPSGVELPWVYAYWVSLLVLMYILCQWFGSYKAAHPEKGWLTFF